MSSSKRARLKAVHDLSQQASDTSSHLKKCPSPRPELRDSRDLQDERRNTRPSTISPILQIVFIVSAFRFRLRQPSGLRRSRTGAGGGYRYRAESRVSGLPGQTRTGRPARTTRPTARSPQRHTPSPERCLAATMRAPSLARSPRSRATARHGPTQDCDSMMRSAP